MDPIAQIEEKLTRHRELKFHDTPTFIAVEPPTADGFTVSLEVVGDEFVVHFDGWHEHFSNPEEALNCFAFAFSGHSRLAITYRGDMPVKWGLEHLRDGQWVSASETGLLLVPFWRESHVVHRQNPTLSHPAA